MLPNCGYGRSNCARVSVDCVEKGRSLHRTLKNDVVLVFGLLYLAACGVQRDRQHHWRVALGAFAHSLRVVNAEDY